jgi:hypothetical protein
VAVGIELTLRTLLGSPNPRATDLLAVALESSVAALRLGAVRALAIRDDEAGHRRLVDLWPRLPADARAALSDLPPSASLKVTLPKLITPDSPKPTRRASEMAVAMGVVDALPAIVAAAAQPHAEFSAVLATDAYHLARRLADAVEHYDPHITADGRPHDTDPAFARRAAINALIGAMDSFGEHHQLDLLRSLLLLTPGDEPACLRVLRDESHAAHEPLHTALRTSSCRGAIEILAVALTDLRASKQLLEIASQRCDRAGLESLLLLVGYPVGLRVRENCQRIASFAWLEEGRRDVLGELSGAAQATAVQLAAASRADRTEVAAAIELLLISDHPAARLAACQAIETLPSPLAVEPIRRALQLDDPAVVASAVRLVRKKDYPGGTALLVEMLDHPDAKVRGAAGSSLRELSFFAFRDSFHEIPAASRPVVGRLVGKADPMAAATLRAELGAGAVSRRLRALEMIGLMGLGDTLVEAVIGCLANDKDIGVRVEAASLLAETAPLPEVIEALVEAVDSRSTAVRVAAQSSVEGLTGLPFSELTGARL